MKSAPADQFGHALCNPRMGVLWSGSSALETRYSNDFEYSTGTQGSRNSLASLNTSMNVVVGSATLFANACPYLAVANSTVQAGAHRCTELASRPCVFMADRKCPCIMAPAECAIRWISGLSLFFRPPIAACNSFAAVINP